MTFVKTTLTAAIFAVASFNANATTFNLGDVTGQPGFGVANNGTGMFDDTINFSLTTAQNMSAILFNFSFDMPQNIIGDMTAPLSYNGTMIDSMSITDNFAAGNWQAMAGDYSIHLVGDFGGYGTYDIDAVLTPVAEPSTMGVNVWRPSSGRTFSLPYS